MRRESPGSTDGLINEYCNPCPAIYEGRQIDLLPLEVPKHVAVDGIDYEALNTSGGIVITFCTVTGRRGGQFAEPSDVRKVYGQTLAGERWSGVQITTAASVCTISICTETADCQLRDSSARMSSSMSFWRIALVDTSPEEHRNDQRVTPTTEPHGSIDSNSVHLKLSRPHTDGTVQPQDAAVQHAILEDVSNE
ncbi:MAG: hypothetical protein O3A00_25385 [Planctomycetota bacterium]|nr:hypothetical protein [Planctomycetota bacterium]